MTEARSGAREWRLYIVAAVAGVYILAWNRITSRPKAEAPPPPRAVWLDELPSALRPAIAPPAGWRVAGRAETIAPIPRRVPVANPPRIRTRSS